jgi:hypothetical protein
MLPPSFDPTHDPADVWPALPQTAWSGTCATLQLWMQIVGKVRLALMPPINHCWGVTLYPTVRGVTTSPMPYGNRTLQIDFDFIDHLLLLENAEGNRQTIPLKPMTVAAFYREFMSALDSLGMPVPIWPIPKKLQSPSLSRRTMYTRTTILNTRSASGASWCKPPGCSPYFALISWAR